MFTNEKDRKVDLSAVCARWALHAGKSGLYAAVYMDFPCSHFF